MVLMKNDALRPASISPTYPPYHTGEYLEEYFFKRWNEENIETDRQYIDVFWTNNFCNSMFAGQQYENIQEELDDALDSDGKYFTVSQFDDGPFEKFPKDTLIFSAGGNREGDNIIPIPLICSSIPKEWIPNKEKTIFASFVGSRNTHPIRMDMCNHLSGKEGYEISAGNWSTTVPMDNFKKFLGITCSSKFGLAPRGYGKSSFRMYEILQLGTVPVYISDVHYLPWSDELDWNDFCVPVNEDEIEDIDTILKSISDVEYNNLLENGKKVYEEYFTLEGMFKNIIKRISS
jgi:hypothetical protein